MASNTYYHPVGFHRTEIVVINSRFITSVDRANTAEEARTFISSIREEMPDASHHVYAFRAGYGNSVTEGMSDDGEPSGTSGPPTLAVLRGADIGDVVLVTTRYFGGIKLGTGGLVRAYTESAQAALANLPKEWRAPKTQIGLDTSYSNYEPIKRLIQHYDGHIDDESFAGNVSIIITLLREKVQSFATDLTDLTAGRSEVIVLQEID